MAHKIIFALFDIYGDPHEAAYPEVVVYRRANGEAVAPPPVVEVGDGFYEFSVDVAAHGPVAYLIDAGVSSAIRYFSGSVGELVAFALYDESGEPAPLMEPYFMDYEDGSAEPVQPSLVNLTGGLYGFWAPPAPGKTTRYTLGNLGQPVTWGVIGGTALLNPVPLSGSIIQNTQVVTFDVKDSEADLGRVLIAIKYPEWNATELAWDGQAVCGPFTITSVPILNGRRYTVLRVGGWPSAPVVRVFLTNQSGREI